MTLKKIKTKYGGNCSKCGREIKPEWEIYFNPDSPKGKGKEIYCIPCGNILSGEKTEKQPPLPEPDGLHETARLDDISLKIDHIINWLTVLGSDIKRFNDKQKDFD